MNIYKQQLNIMLKATTSRDRTMTLARTSRTTMAALTLSGMGSQTNAQVGGGLRGSPR